VSDLLIFLLPSSIDFLMSLTPVSGARGPCGCLLKVSNAQEILTDDRSKTLKINDIKNRNKK